MCYLAQDIQTEMFLASFTMSYLKQCMANSFRPVMLDYFWLTLTKSWLNGISAVIDKTEPIYVSKLRTEKYVGSVINFWA